MAARPKSSMRSRSIARSFRSSASWLWVRRACFSVFEHAVGADGQHRMPPAAGDVAQGVGEKRLADPDGADDGDVVMALQEAERGELVEEGAIEGHLRRRVPGFELSAGIEARALGSHGRGQPVAAGDLIAEDEEKEVLVGELLLPGEGQAFGQGVEPPGELEAAEHGLQVSGDGIGRHAGSPSSRAGRGSA
jgi:hypothetical protein